MVWFEGQPQDCSYSGFLFELYDVKNDPYEMVNLADNPKYAKVLKDMKKKLRELRKQVGDTDEAYPELKKVIDEALR